ncbi:MAG: hypothetical protein ACK41V_13535 [Acidovorax sp.]|uniref:hypothetical protein n=1 Tax=Acidovorax sp. TaxID=1872122 RepID=UPI00391DF9EC
MATTTTTSAAAARVPMSVWAGLGVLVVGLGVSLALLTGFGQSMACGTFGLDCIAAAFGMVLCTVCASLVLLLRGLVTMRRSGGFSVAKVLTASIAGVIALAMVLLLGFAVLVVLR